MKKVVVFLVAMLISVPASAFENFGISTASGGFSDFFHMSFFTIISLATAVMTGSLLALVESEFVRFEFLKKEIEKTEMAIKELSDNCISFTDTYSNGYDEMKKVEKEIGKINDGTKLLTAQLPKIQG